jgi:pyruvate kinase
MDVARLNFSHGDYKDTPPSSPPGCAPPPEEEGRFVALLQDIQGPKAAASGRSPAAASSGRTAPACDSSRARARATPSTSTIDYPHLVEDIQKGERVLLADGQSGSMSPVPRRTGSRR